MMRLYYFALFLILPIVKMLNCRPFTILAKGLIGTTRSSLFLSVYCASAWLVSTNLFLALLFCYWLSCCQISFQVIQDFQLLL